MIPCVLQATVGRDVFYAVGRDAGHHIGSNALKLM